MVSILLEIPRDAIHTGDLLELPMDANWRPPGSSMGRLPMSREEQLVYRPDSPKPHRYRGVPRFRVLGAKNLIREECGWLVQGKSVH